MGRRGEQRVFGVMVMLVESPDNPQFLPEGGYSKEICKETTETFARPVHRAGKSGREMFQKKVMNLVEKKRVRGAKIKIL